MSSNFPTPEQGEKSAEKSASKPLDPACAVYLEMSAKMAKQGDKEHAHFFQSMSNTCQTYKEQESSFTPEGQKALQEIRPRLATGLKNDADANPQKSGADLKATWLRNHPQVYKESGVCALPHEDKAKIVATASPLLRENPSMAAQAVMGAFNSLAKQATGADPLHPSYRAASASSSSGNKK